MPEPFVTGGLIMTGWAGRKVLGPTFDQIGEDLRARYSDYRARNVARIGKNAQAKLGATLDDQGTVPPRVALRVFEEGSWCDAPVMAEYFGGILAASRSETGNDDRGASWAALVSRLSTFDVLLHYLAYEALRRLMKGGDDLNFGLEPVRDACQIYLPADATLAAMKQEVTGEAWGELVAPAFNALVREDLVGSKYWYGGPDWIESQFRVEPPDGGLVFTPSIPGIELFLWAHGYGRSHVNAIIDADMVFDSVEDLGSVSGAATIQSMREEKKLRDETRAKGQE